MAKIDDSVKKKVPELRFKGFTDEWEERKFKDILKTHSFRSYLAGVSENGEYEVIQQGDKPIVGYSDGEPFTDYKDVTLFGDHTVSLYKPKSPFFVATDGVKILSADNFEGNYLYTTLERYKPEPQGYKRHFTILKNQDVWFTENMEEQQKIGSLFKQLDDTIALHQRKLDLLKEQKKGYLQKMFPKNGAKVPELRFAGFADDWEERKLGDVGDTFTGLTGKTKEDFGHGSAKFVTYVNVFQNPIATLDQLDAVEIDEKQNQVQKGDVFFTTSSETPEEVGMSSVWTYDTKNVYLNSFTFGYRPRVSFDLNYMASMLRSPSIRKKITFLAQGISRYNISKTKMLEIEIPAPNLSEQTKIGLFFKGLDDTIALHQRKLDLLKEQKKGFLQKMFV